MKENELHEDAAQKGKNKKPHGAPTVPPFLGGPVISRFGVATVEMEMSAGDMRTVRLSSANISCLYFLMVAI